jgi:hypothetical protein
MLAERMFGKYDHNFSAQLGVYIENGEVYTGLPDFGEGGAVELLR